MVPPRAPITCHVLDTLTGTPGRSIHVRITLLANSLLPKTLDARKLDISFHGVTNSDGRITSWTATQSKSLEEVFEEMEGDMLWVIEFHTDVYWRERGVKAFFPEVEIKFVTEGFRGMAEGERSKHWHVPLLMGPFSYTTYRGS